MGQLAATTRILVTHHVHFLRDADAVIVVDGGRIVQKGIVQLAVELLCLS